MQCKIKINSTGEIVYCDRQYDSAAKQPVYYKSPDSTETYDKNDITLIPQEPYELFGIECGKGWNELLKPIFTYIEEYNKDKPEDKQIVPLQVKEKFGSLRFYTNFETDELRDIISDAEVESWVTCEECGSKEHIGHTRGWIQTICHDCISKRAKANKRSYLWDDYKTGEKLTV